MCALASGNVGMDINFLRQPPQRRPMGYLIVQRAAILIDWSDSGDIAMRCYKPRPSYRARMSVKTGPVLEGQRDASATSLASRCCGLR